MTIKQNHQILADYNQWMNQNIYQAASQLSNEDLTKDRGAFFDSILGTLNHILVGDTRWQQRFANNQPQIKSLDYVRALDTPPTLDTILFNTLQPLATAREEMDNTIIAFSNELNSEALSSTLAYQASNGEPFSKNLGHVLIHFFNHQTHHRGQVTNMLSQAEVDVGVTDILFRLPDQ